METPDGLRNARETSCVVASGLISHTYTVTLKHIRLLFWALLSLKLHSYKPLNGISTLGRKALFHYVGDEPICFLAQIV